MSSVQVRRHAVGWIPAVIASNAIGAPVDTVLFLALAGFPIWTAVPGQLLAKAIAEPQSDRATLWSLPHIGSGPASGPPAIGRAATRVARIPDLAVRRRTGGVFRPIRPRTAAIEAIQCETLLAGPSLSVARPVTSAGSLIPGRLAGPYPSAPTDA
jgi:hypothetical protein